jgi:hypothetical protein
VTVITPVFDDAGSHILFYVGSRGHHADIGGMTPGSMPPDSTVVEEEGVLFDNWKLVDAGVLLLQKQMEIQVTQQAIENLRIETGADRCDPAAVSRTGSFRAADNRLILCLGPTDSPVFERRLSEIVRAAANYHAVAALAAESTTALATIRFLNDPDCDVENASCTYTTGGNNRVAPGGKLFVDVTATESAVHAYALLLDGRNFRIQPLNGADNAVDPPIDPGISRRLFAGQFGAAGNLDILVLVTPEPLSLAALHQQPVRAVGGRLPSALERLLASAGQGRRDAPEPVPEAWNAQLTHFTIGATK